MTGSSDGLRVLDFSRILAGPFATMQLADFGATVTKVDAPAPATTPVAGARPTTSMGNRPTSRRSTAIRTASSST